MSIPSGMRLGPYEILAPIGAGGMGEVYRGRDTRLERDVAVKVLPPAFLADPGRLRRFEQEGKAAAALNHPNVVVVFDVGVEGDAPYVVMELLEGETLRETLKRGPLPPRKAAELAVQVAFGLAAAHQKGIVHRDLKPDNIFVTPEGRAKIFDFGLAKLVVRADPHPSLSHLPTLEATSPGAVLGTVGYASPEQVRGEGADHRADIFALGAVLYEMLAGRRAFAAASAAETMAAILREDPPELPAVAAAPQLGRIVRRCLEKSPSERFQSASDVAFALEAVSVATGSLPAPAAISARPSGRALLLAALVAAGLVVAVVLASRPPKPRPAVVAFEARTFDRLPITGARFMRDGQTIVYSATPRGDAPELFVIHPDAEAPQPLGVRDAHLLSVSSQGELALITGARHIEQRLFGGTLARMTLGSSPRAVSQDVREADWSPDGNALAVVHDLGNGRDRLEYPAGTALYEASGYLSDPRASPDGDSVAFFEHQWRFDDRGWLKVVSRAGSVRTLAGELWGLQGLAWTPDGSSLVFSGSTTGGVLLEPMAVPASGRSEARAVFGVPGRLVVHDVAPDGRWLAVREDLSFGVRVRGPGQDAERELSWLGSAGARSLSRDGQWLLMVDVGPRGGRDYGVVLRRTDASQTIRLGAGNAQTLSPDGKRAAAIIASPPQLLVYPTGPGEPIRLVAGALERILSAAWFPGGERLFVCGAQAGQAPRCYGQDLAGAPPTPLTPAGAVATLAPDGETLLLTLQDGSPQLASLAGGAPRPARGLRAGDRHIAWSRDSRAVYVQASPQVPVSVERVELASGARSVVRRLEPEGVANVATLYVADWVEDGPWYVYNYTSLPSTLFVVRNALN